MDREQRLRLIHEIENKRESRLICYITGDRENVNTRIAPDIIRVFYRHLKKIGWNKRIDLFLYTRGGDVLTPWRLVNLIREYGETFGVLVPFRAYSAGTLICLGAEEIVMGKMGELGPIDPSVANAFNPPDPNNPMARIPVSVEDVTSYIALARERVRLTAKDSLLEVFTLLSEKVHPLALGNVHRNYDLIRFMARKLLMLPRVERSEELVLEIVNYLTEKLYAHNYMIPRSEAKLDIKLPVLEPDEKLEQLMWSLYEGYEEELKLFKPFNPGVLLGRQRQVDFEITGGLIESREGLDGFVFNGRVTQPPINQEEPANPNVNIWQQGWRRIE